MDTNHYNEWEADRNRRALSEAQELIDDYKNNQIKFISYKTNQTKDVLLYTYMKIWHILNGSGIFLEYKVYQKADKCLVELYLSDPL
jgi:hypothetical protein